MSIDDAQHYTPERRAQIIASYLPHEREARAKGIPVLGSGRVFPIEEERIRVEPIQIPALWPQIVGIDFGWDHPFAAVRLAWDRDNDCIYVCAEYRERETTPIIHAAAIKGWGSWQPIAWPHDGLQHDKGSGEPLANQYRAHGLNMLPEKAEWEDGGYGFEAGINEMLERMQTGRLKVFSTCGSWFGEFRLYHREDGIVVKLQDDLLSATRVGIMMKRFASVQKSDAWKQPPPKWVV